MEKAVSYTYDLVCMETGEKLSLGKWTHKNVFGGFRDFDKEKELGDKRRDVIFLTQERLWELVTRFLIRNRGKEIRVLPSDWLCYLPEEFGDNRLVWIESWSKYMSEPITPEPDAYQEMFTTPPELADRLMALPELPDAVVHRFDISNPPPDSPAQANRALTLRCARPAAHCVKPTSDAVFATNPPPTHRLTQTSDTTRRNHPPRRATGGFVSSVLCQARPNVPAPPPVSAAACASRKKRSRSCSFTASGGRNFSATVRCNFRSSARYTTPMPPGPTAR